MELKEIAESLSEIEKAALKALEKGGSLKAGQIAEIAAINVDSARRAVGWLKEKGLADAEERPLLVVSLTAAGKEAVEKGLPEKRFIAALNRLGGKAGLEEVQDKAGLGKEINFAMGIAKRNAWISVHKDEKGAVVELTGLEKDVIGGRYIDEIVLGKIAGNALLGKEEEKKVDELARRGLAEKRAVVEIAVRINEQGRKALEIASGIKERAFVVSGASAEVPELFAGKRQPYIRFLGGVRRKLVELGFKEMDSPLIVQEFYNFDVLFQPQNHPARSWSDTYQLKQPKEGELPNARIVAKVKAAHENGAGTGSRGWGYKWDERIAKRLMPSAHGTAHSARQLVKGVEVPGKYFALARCYRPDVVDASHLNEFNQLEGFIVGRGFTFRHLLGMLKEFALEIAKAEEVKFYPDYYPFTEPSVQLSAKHRKLGWIEFGGAGIFRPEVTEPLGIKEPVLAWGLGVDRLAMCALGVNDMRHLFSSDLGLLRNAEVR